MNSYIYVRCEVSMELEYLLSLAINVRKISSAALLLVLLVIYRICECLGVDPGTLPNEKICHTYYLFLAIATQSVLDSNISISNI